MIGQRLGQYEIVGELGEGGMATVYRARQVSINREVALKVIKPDLTEEPGFITRFEREARMIASLSHPHILKLFDYGREGDNVYLVTELLSGGALSDLVEQGPLPLDKIDRLLDQIASALDYAHQQGIIHRDLKPRNVLMDKNGNAILTDFGLAKLVVEDTRLTATGAAMGTPSYMSPEQWRGEPIDARADIYALGVMLYEMIAGKLPFKADSVFSLMFAHVNELPPSIESLPADLSPDINRIVQRALAKDRNDRFESAAALASSFHQVATGGKYVTPPSMPTTYQQFTPVKNLMQPASRKGLLWPMAVAGAALVLILILIALLVGGSKGTPLASAPTSPPDAASIKVAPVAPDEFMVLVAQPEQLGKQPRDITRFIVADLTQNLDKNIPFSKLRIRELPQVITSALDAQAAAKANNATVVVWGSASDDSVDLHVQIGITSAFKYVKMSEDLIRRTGDVRIKLTDPRTQSIAPQVLTVLSILEGADGNGYEIMRSLALLDRLSVQSGEIQGKGTAPQLSRAMMIYLSDTQGFIQQMTTIIDADSSNPLPYAYRGLAYQRLAMFEEGVRDYATAGKLGPEGWTGALYGLSIDAFFSRKDFNEGILHYSEIIKDRPDDWFPLSMRGSMYYFIGKLDLAKADLDKSMTLNPDANLPYSLSARLALHQGRINDARQLFDLVLTRFPDPHLFERIFRAAFGDPNDRKVAYGSILSASTNLLIGQYDSAVTDIQAAIDVFPNFSDLYMLKGFAQCSLGKYVDAEKSLSQGITLDPTFALMYALRAEVRRKQNNAPGALFDVATLSNLETGKELTSLIQSGIKDGSPGSCQSFFSYKPSTSK